MACLRGAAEPHRRLGIVRRQLAALGVQVADRRRRLRIAGERGTAQPGLALDRIRRDGQALHQCHAPARLARTIALLGRLAEQLDGGGAIRRHGHAALGHDAEQILRGRQSGVRRPAQILRHLRLLLRRRRVACQRQGIAECALRAAGGGRRSYQGCASSGSRIVLRARRSGCTRAPPGHRRSRLRPPCAPSGGRSRNPAPPPRWRRTAWRPIRLSALAVRPWIARVASCACAST